MLLFDNRPRIFHNNDRSLELHLLGRKYNVSVLSPYPWRWKGKVRPQDSYCSLLLYQDASDCNGWCKNQFQQKRRQPTLLRIGHLRVHRMFTFLTGFMRYTESNRRTPRGGGRPTSRDDNEANRLEAMAITFKDKASTFKPQGQDGGQWHRWGRNIGGGYAVSTLSRLWSRLPTINRKLFSRTRDCNPGIPDPWGAEPFFFQSRNPWIMRDQIPGFRD